MEVVKIESFSINKMIGKREERIAVIPGTLSRDEQLCGLGVCGITVLEPVSPYCPRKEVGFPAAGDLD